ncbi:MAG: class II aldolase/adducin family protein [Clostridiales bacterium]|nr:class II aldolase/adducin family protein [Clostridiales bacterium]
MSYQFESQYPGDYEVKKTILEIGRRMYAKNFVAANDGNISAKVSDDTIWCTPTGVSKGYMTDDMLVLMDLDGNVIKGNCKPSSEVKMHLRVYNENPDVKAVVHAHPPAATSYAIAGLPLNRAILTEAVMGIGEIPLAPYAMPGTEEVPDSITPFIRSHNGCLLANHGAITWGKDAMEAWMRMESVEYYALVSMYTNALIGQANELTCSQVDRLIERRTNSGIYTGGRPLCRNCGPDGVPACAKGGCSHDHSGDSSSHTCSCGGSTDEEKNEAEMVAQIVRQILSDNRFRG